MASNVLDLSSPLINTETYTQPITNYPAITALNQRHLSPLAMCAPSQPTRSPQELLKNIVIVSTKKAAEKKRLVMSRSHEVIVLHAGTGLEAD
jgi:hypothetical protein